MGLIFYSFDKILAQNYEKLAIVNK